MHLPPWPTILLETASEADAVQFVRDLEQLVGPSPQAELIEPWEPGLPWRVRVDHPQLSSERVDAILALHEGVSIEPGVLPGARAARDLGAVLPDEIGGAVLWSDAVEGGLCPPDLDEEAPEPPGAALASELVAAVRAVSAELVPDLSEAVDFVRHRPTGRRGLRVRIPEKPLEALSGDQLLALRAEVVAAIEGVIHRRRTSTIGLAPDLSWDPRMGLSIIAWRTDAPGPHLPGDSVVEPGLEPALDDLPALDLGGRVHALEVQVVPDDPGEHEAVALACAEALAGSELVGAEPRWVFARSAGGIVATFCPCWHAPETSLSTLGPHLAIMKDLPGVLAVRVVPIDPVGLEDVAGYLDPCWRWTGSHWIVRWRDGVRDRDRLVAWVARDAEPADGAAAMALARALGGVPGLEIRQDAEGRRLRPIRDDQGRHGLALHLAPALATDPMRLAWLFSALGAVSLPGWSDVVDLALPVDGVLLHFWRRPATDKEAEPPVWVSVG